MANSRDEAVRPLPEAVRVDLERMAQAQAALRREMDAVVRTVRATLNVPADWVLPSLEAGFVPPGEQGQE